MESDESIDLIHSQAVNACGSVVAKEEYENPCEHSEKGENVDPPRFQKNNDTSIFFIEVCHPC